MSTTQYLNELSTERAALDAVDVSKLNREEEISFLIRLGEWWHRRDIGFGDGSGMKACCFNRAEELKRLANEECEFCGDPATHIEQFDREVFVCSACHAN